MSFHGFSGRLSRHTASRVNWSLINDTLGLQTTVSRDTAAVASSNAERIGERDREAIAAAFNVVKSEFQKTLGWLQRTMRWIIVVTLASMALSVAGAALLLVSPYFGIVSIAGIVSMLGALRTAWLLARDQAMLELVPTRYELALSLCATKGDAQRLVDAFLSETGSIRKD